MSSLHMLRKPFSYQTSDTEGESDAGVSGDNESGKSQESTVAKEEHPLDHPLEEEGPILVEIGAEVAHKSGGVYTVIKTKVPSMISQWENRYALIGMYNPVSAQVEFEELSPSPLAGRVMKKVKEEYKMTVHYGRWLVYGYPRVFLIEVETQRNMLDAWRHELMPGFGDPTDEEVNVCLLFGFQTALLLKALADDSPKRRFVAHFHEWNAGVGLIVSRKWNLNIATLFTTHATQVGRWLAAAHVDLYRQLPYLNADEEASRRCIYLRHWIEKEAAQQAHIFTTVSDITSLEAEHILGRKADEITPNGLTIKKFAAIHEFQNLHAQSKKILQTFVKGHFFGHYDFDLDETIFMFLAGRYEYTNKGCDIFIEALARLNHELKGTNKTVVAFIIMNTEVTGYNVETLEGQSVIRDLKRTCDVMVEDINERMFESLARGVVPSASSLLTADDLVKLKKRTRLVQTRRNLPPICTHNVVNDGNDDVLRNLRRVQLFNRNEDRVKVIYHPQFLNSTSPVLPLDYADFVRGCHLGVFPSYYEPWGYTPAECTVLGVPSITSNLTGFSNYMERRIDEPAKHGIFIVDRINRTWEESVNQTKNIMWRFLQLNRRQRISLRNHTERLSKLVDWKQLRTHYFNAHSKAVKKQFKAALRPSNSYADMSELEI